MTSLKDSNLKNPDNETIPVLKLHSKGKLVAKENKGFPNMEDTEPWLKKFQSKSKLTASILPKNLSKLVSKHKERYKDYFDDEFMEEKSEADTDKTSIHEENDGDITNSGHSWHVPVKDLIIEDMAVCGKNTVSNSQNLDNSVQSANHKRSLGRQKGQFKSSIDELDTVIHTGQSLDESENHVAEESRSDSNSCVKKMTHKRKNRDTGYENDSFDGSVSPDLKDEAGNGNLKKRKVRAANVKPAAKRQKLDSGAPLPVVKYFEICLTCHHSFLWFDNFNSLSDNKKFSLVQMESIFR